MKLDQKNTVHPSESQNTSEHPPYAEAEYEILDPDPSEESETLSPEPAPYAGTGSIAEQDTAEKEKPFLAPPAHTEEKASIRFEEPFKQAGLPGKEQEPVPESKKKASPLSIVAFIGSFLGWLSVPAIILAVIDLVKGNKERHRHGLSIAAIIVGAVMLLSMIGLTRIRAAAQESEAVRPSQSQTQTQQTKAPKSAATKVPAQRTEAPKQQQAQQPAAENKPEEKPTVYRFEAPAQPAAYIESITLDGLGHAELHIAETGIQTDEMMFGLYYIIVREPEKGPVPLSADANGHISFYNQAFPIASANQELNHYSIGYGPRFSDKAYARVFPGQYMQFYLLQNKSLENQIYWTSGPIFIPESAATEAPPLELVDAKSKFLNKDYSETGIIYSFSTAEDLNRMLDVLPSTDRGLWDDFTFRPNSSAKVFNSWKNSGKEHFCTPVLYGPGFAFIGPEYSLSSSDLPKDGISLFTCDYPSLFAASDSPSSRPHGGYPAGTYVLAVYIDGTYCGGYQITLQ